MPAEPWPRPMKREDLPDISAAKAAWSTYYDKLLPLEYTRKTSRERWNGTKWEPAKFRNEIMCGKLLDHSIGYNTQSFEDENHGSMSAGGANGEYGFNVSKAKPSDKWRLSKLTRNIKDQKSPFKFHNSPEGAAIMIAGRATTEEITENKQAVYRTVTNNDGTVTLTWDYLLPLMLSHGPIDPTLMPLFHGEIVLDPKQSWVILNAKTSMVPSHEGTSFLNGHYDTVESKYEYGTWRGMPVVVKQVGIEHRIDPTGNERERWTRDTTTFEWKDFDQAKLPMTRLPYYGLPEPEKDTKDKAMKPLPRLPWPTNPDPQKK
jgi:hypothetical protein